MTAPEPQRPSWDGLLGRAPDYEAASPVNRAVWADLSQRLPHDAYPRFPRDTEAAHDHLERIARFSAPSTAGSLGKKDRP
jgi:hypothetical protein